MIRRSCNPIGPNEQRLFGITAIFDFMEAFERAFYNMILFKSQRSSHVNPVSGFPSSAPGLRVAKVNRFNYPASESIEFYYSLKRELCRKE